MLIIYKNIYNKSHIILYPLILLITFDDRAFYYLAENILGTILLYLLFVNKSKILLFISLLLKPFSIFFLVLFKKSKLVLLIYIPFLIFFYNRTALAWILGQGIYSQDHVPYFLTENFIFVIMFVAIITKIKNRTKQLVYVLLFLLIFIQPSHHHYSLILYPSIFLEYFCPSQMISRSWPGGQNIFRS